MDERLRQGCYLKALGVVFDRYKIDIDRILVEDKYWETTKMIAKKMIKTYEEMD